MTVDFFLAFFFFLAQNAITQTDHLPLLLEPAQTDFILYTDLNTIKTCQYFRSLTEPALESEAFSTWDICRWETSWMSRRLRRALCLSSRIPSECFLCEMLCGSSLEGILSTLPGLWLSAHLKIRHIPSLWAAARSWGAGRCAGGPTLACPSSCMHYISECVSLRV